MGGGGNGAPWAIQPAQMDLTDMPIRTNIMELTGLSLESSKFKEFPQKAAMKSSQPLYFTYHNDENIKTVPEAPKIIQPVNVNFQDFFHHIIKDKEAKYNFAGSQEEIESGKVMNQLHRLELPRGEQASCGWELHQ